MVLSSKISPNQISQEYLPYYNKILRIREIFEKEIDYFPNYCCSFSAKVINILTGLEEVAGMFCLSEIVHACNYDADNQLYIDITASQFDNSLKGVLIHNEVSLFIPHPLLTTKHLSYYLPIDENISRIMEMERIVKIALQDPLFSEVKYDSLIYP